MTSAAGSKTDSKTIICCFDGTGNKFGENSHVIRLFSAFTKNKPTNQVVYYQPGIGTYTKHQYITKTAALISTYLDQAIAWYLNDHVKEGYKFIMQHFNKGDKICLFGFSRGAYTARVLMGMLYKVGLLPPDNIEQLDFAFSVYEMTGEHGCELSRQFKKSFSLAVTVEFVGVWDTVASVGLIPRFSRHPYTSVNYAVKTLRHALALDERRIRFQPLTWNEANTDCEQELDVDEPTGTFQPAEGLSKYEREYIPPQRNFADVKEVWFAGCHADIGGGSHHNRYTTSLSYVPLRWMILEIEAANCGILFDKSYLVEELDFQYAKDSGDFKLIAPQDRDAGFSGGPSLPHTRQDTLAQMYDQLVVATALHLWLWWMIEFLPLLLTYQKRDGKWTKEKVCNLGDGRNVPFNVDDGKVLVHKSVENRIKKKDIDYIPQARNWKALEAHDRIQYV